MLEKETMSQADHMRDPGAVVSGAAGNQYILINYSYDQAFAPQQFTWRIRLPQTILPLIVSRRTWSLPTEDTPRSSQKQVHV